MPILIGPETRPLVPIAGANLTAERSLVLTPAAAGGKSSHAAT